MSALQIIVISLVSLGIFALMAARNSSQQRKLQDLSAAKDNPKLSPEADKSKVSNHSDLMEC